MSAPAQPKFYKPTFGNDNFIGQDIVDISSFTSPALRRVDPAIAVSAKKAEAL